MSKLIKHSSLLTIVTLDEDKITDYAAARNKLLQQVKTPWALYLDSDEKLAPESLSNIERALNSGNYAGYRLKRVDYFLGQRLQGGETGNVSFVRLAKVAVGRWIRPVHEIWQIKGRVGELTNVEIVHRPHPQISSFLAKIDHYSSIEAQYRHQSGINSTLGHIFFYPLGKFFLNYLVKSGWRDGVPGIIMAIMMSFHSFLTWTKLYLLWHQK